ncbi:uncharacterized protein N7496_003853 [Penicillium cataractarum]|uniref:Uncharacterized protein n=1 Tax=Penicillium cataractarum TaxID=2100454 RepID=A0A9W9SN02_9EURO|nr:uncharacterized protein N7496_003853 [Penicillium cataractarum]KAJ5381425.1 hypothetical protein N7496_003853 [Penicillium cataractarum]
MATANPPEIFLLSLAYLEFLDQTYSSLIDKLAASATLKRAKKADAAIRYLEQNNPKAIIITDQGLTERANANVLQKVVSYIRNGGIAIVGLHFPSFVTMDAMNNFFASGFALPWKRGDYHRTDFAFNPSYNLPREVNASSLPGPYSMKTLHIMDARPSEKIFVPIANAQTQSHVFPPGYVDQSQAAVTGAKIGNGHLIYCGDVNGEAGSDSVILAFCGL